MGRKTEGLKADNADAPVYLWGCWLEAGLGSSLPAGWRGAIGTVRSFLLQQWKRRLTCNFWIWLRSTNQAGVSVSRPPPGRGWRSRLLRESPRVNDTLGIEKAAAEPGRAVEVTPGLGAAGATIGDGATVSERKGK